MPVLCRQAISPVSLVGKFRVPVNKIDRTHGSVDSPSGLRCPLGPPVRMITWVLNPRLGRLLSTSSCMLAARLGRRRPWWWLKWWRRCNVLCLWHMLRLLLLRIGLVLLVLHLHRWCIV